MDCQAVDSTKNCSAPKEITPTEPAEHSQSLEGLNHQIAVITERNLAKALGNVERLEKWRQAQSFAATRKEWWNAWNILAKRHGFAPALKVRAGKEIAGTC